MRRGWRATLLGLLVILPACAPAPTSAPSPAPVGESVSSAATSSSPSPSPSPDLGPGFHALDFTTYRPFPATNPAFHVEGSELVCSGTPRSYFHSPGTYRNFTLRGEFRFEPEPATTDAAQLERFNTGFLLYIAEPHKVWPVSLEVQGKFPEMAAIKANGGAAQPVVQDDEAARTQARNPVGEWNAVEITSQDGSVTAALNGVVISRSEPGELSEGLIGFQSEGCAVRFRNFEIEQH